MRSNWRKTPFLCKDPALHPLRRRWDQTAGDPAEGGLTLANDNAAFIQEGEGWLVLEDSVQIRFRPADPAHKNGTGTHAPRNWYRTGDYWLIPARTATGDAEWPKVTDAKGNLETDADGNTIPFALPPHGITHHYAPLAVISAVTSDKDAIAAASLITLWKPNRSRGSQTRSPIRKHFPSEEPNDKDTAGHKGSAAACGECVFLPQTSPTKCASVLAIDALWHAS
jgi:hypothetical protein